MTRRQWGGSEERRRPDLLGHLVLHVFLRRPLAGEGHDQLRESAGFSVPVQLVLVNEILQEPRQIQSQAGSKTTRTRASNEQIFSPFSGSCTRRRAAQGPASHRIPSAPPFPEIPTGRRQRASLTWLGRLGGGGDYKRRRLPDQTAAAWRACAYL